jgi:hypothetical protein
VRCMVKNSSLPIEAMHHDQNRYVELHALG